MHLLWSILFARLHNFIKAGFRVVIVTSGAIAAGRHYYLKSSLNFLQLLRQNSFSRSRAESSLFKPGKKLFAIYDIHIGQILLTRADIGRPWTRFLNARDTLHALLDNHIIPVINENDAVATAEIKVGDNDNLSALVAILVASGTTLFINGSTRFVRKRSS